MTEIQHSLIELFVVQLNWVWCAQTLDFNKILTSLDIYSSLLDTGGKKGQYSTAFQIFMYIIWASQHWVLGL